MFDLVENCKGHVCDKIGAGNCNENVSSQIIEISIDRCIEHVGHYQAADVDEQLVEDVVSVPILHRFYCYKIPQICKAQYY